MNSEITVKSVKGITTILASHSRGDEAKCLMHCSGIGYSVGYGDGMDWDNDRIGYRHTLEEAVDLYNSIKFKDE